jgi:hypothetical protein
MFNNISNCIQTFQNRQRKPLILLCHKHAHVVHRNFTRRKNFHLEFGGGIEQVSRPQPCSVVGRWQRAASLSKRNLGLALLQKQSVVHLQSSVFRATKGSKSCLVRRNKKLLRHFAERKAFHSLIVRRSIKNELANSKKKCSSAASSRRRLRHTHNVTYCLLAAIILYRYIILRRNNTHSLRGRTGEGVWLTFNLYSIRLGLHAEVYVHSLTLVWRRH